MIVFGPDVRVPPQLGTLQLVFFIVAYNVMEMLDAMYPATYTITSWYRDPMRNAQVGGVPNSKHITGLAIDYTIERSLLPSIACGIGSVFGLCKEPPIGYAGKAWRAIAPPFTQTVNEPNGSGHWELDLS